MEPPTTGSLLLKLPVELQDAICDFVAEGQTRPVLRIKIEQDRTTQHKHPQACAFIISGLSNTCWHLRCLFSAALERHIEAIMTRKSRDELPRLMPTTELHYHDPLRPPITTTASRIYVSTVSGNKNDKRPMQKVHAIAASIPIEVKLGQPILIERELVVIFVTGGSESKLLPSRQSIPISQQPLDEWGTSDYEWDPSSHWISVDAITALEEIMYAVKGTKWGAKMRYYTLWFDYVVRFAPKSASESRLL